MWVLPVARKPCGATVLAVALAFASAVLGADETAPVPKPEVKVGEWWRYRTTDYPSNLPRVRNSEMRVSFVGSNEILTVNRGDKDSVWTPEWSAVSLGGSGVTYDKPRQLLNFPLKVGATHKTTYEVVARRGSGRLSRFEEPKWLAGKTSCARGKVPRFKLEGSGYQR
jgi:hypothetical protein